MIAALDSSFDAPTLAQAEAAAAAGVRAWGGYLATQQRPGAFNLAAPWSRLAFWNVQQAGMRAIAFCSGWDDPVALRQLAAEWDVLLVLDDEDGIRPLSTPDWRPAFLDASGAGLYGLLARHDIAAPWRIAAQYPTGGCTGATWPVSPAPAQPHGWQCQGTHTDPATGLSVDSMRLDDWFGGSDMVVQLDGSGNDQVVDKIVNNLEYIADIVRAGSDPSDPSGSSFLPARLNGLPAAVVAALPPAAAGGVTVEQLQGAVAAAVQPLADQLDRIEKALQGA